MSAILNDDNLFEIITLEDENTVENTIKDDNLPKKLDETIYNLDCISGCVEIHHKNGSVERYSPKTIQYNIFNREISNKSLDSIDFIYEESSNIKRRRSSPRVITPPMNEKHNDLNIPSPLFKPSPLEQKEKSSTSKSNSSLLKSPMDKGFHPYKQDQTKWSKSFKRCMSNPNINLTDKRFFFYELLERNRKKIISILQIISLKYDDLNNKYNHFSLIVLIISAIITLLNGVSLVLTDYLKEINNRDFLIDLNMMTNIIILTLGTLLTILTSFIRFKNYREVIDRLKELEEKLITLKAFYSKEQNYLFVMKDDDEFNNNILPKSIEKLNHEFNTLNIMTFLSNNDIIKYNKRLTYISKKLNEFNPNM